MRKQKAIHLLIVLGLGAAGTVQYFGAQFASGFDTFFGDRGDARGFVYFCEHWYQSILGKANLLSPAIFYPTPGTLAYSDLLVGFALPYSILRTAGLEMFSAVQAVIITLTFATYIVCFILLNRVLRFDLLPACAGAMFFAFSSPKYFQTGHLQLQFIISLPAIFALMISFSRQRAGLTQAKAALYLSLAGLLLLLQLVTAFYYAWFFVLWGLLFLVLALIRRPSRSHILGLIRHHTKAMLASAAVFLIGFIAFVLVYRRTLRVGTWYSYQNVTEMIPAWWSLLSMGDGNYLWGRLSAAVRPNPWPAAWGELMVGVGLIVSLTWICLTVYAVWLIITALRKSPAKNSALQTGQSEAANKSFLVAMILATTLLLLIGFKYGQWGSPWYFVYQYFPGAGAIRAMARYVIVLTLPMSIGLAYAAHIAMRWALNQQSLARRVVLTLAITFIMTFAVFEQFGSFKVGGTGFSKRVENAYLKAMAAKLDGDCEAFYVAPGKGKHNVFEYQYDAMLISIMSRIPTLNASSSQFPPQWEHLYAVKDPEYETHVKNWIALHNLRGKICRLEIKPQVETFVHGRINALDDPSFFVSQHYRDFSASEPPADQLNAIVSRLQNCSEGDPSCAREAVSLDLFRSTGFSEDGSFIFRVYQVALGRPPRYQEFFSALAEFRRLSQSGQSADVAKDGVIDKVMQTPEYTGRADSGPGTRESLRARIDSDEMVRTLRNPALVTLRYFGYLRRDPEGEGLKRWLEGFNQTGDERHLTAGFVNSGEYRERFEF